MKLVRVYLIVVCCFVAVSSIAEDLYEIPTITVLGNKEGFEEPGSFHSVGSKQLKEEAISDPHTILEKVPGVYVQQEDGYGLRPNIGLRGAHPHRSKKVTLLEDGVLVAPAPYSAPAAYYFPLMSRIVNMEVYKGPSSIKYGPNSIGGAVNMSTRGIPTKQVNHLSYSLGSYGTQHINIWTGGNNNKWSWLAELSRGMSEGFKELPTNDSTGFQRNDLLMKLAYQLQENSISGVELKLNIANEKSHETYLGLTVDDFNSNSLQRYAASAKDLMKWDYNQIQVRYFKQLNEKWFSSLTAYNHNYRRAWEKLDSFRSSPNSISDILDSPIGINQTYYDVLTGSMDTVGVNDQLKLGRNARAYLSRGIHWELLYEDDVSQTQWDLGLLVHHDQIERNHTFKYFEMNSRNLVRTSDPEQIVTNGQNLDQSFAYRLHVTHQKKYNKWTFRQGFRFEDVTAERDDYLTTTEDRKRNDQVFVPGISASYKIRKDQMMFAGIYKGITLPGPAQKENIAAEEAVNFELGYRLRYPVFLELVAFFSDYQNIIGTCSFSAGCSSSSLDVQFNGGKGYIYGLEVGMGFEANYKGWKFPLEFSSTITKAEFRSEFTTTNPEWGNGTVYVGDPLPYLPEFKWAGHVGAKKGKLSSKLILKSQSKMFDQAVQNGRKEVPGFGVVSLNLGYQWSQDLKVLFKAENILNRTYYVSYRPFGVRPGQPFWTTLGLNYKF